MKSSLQFLTFGLLMLASYNVKSQNRLAASASWKLTGNAGTDSKINFLGTTDYNALIFKTNNIERMHIGKLGNVGIGTAYPSGRLNIVGTSYVSLTSPGYLRLGDSENYNMNLDVNIIQAQHAAAAANLYMNYYGGTTLIGSGGVGIKVISDGTVGIRGDANSSYALNVNADASYNGINITDPVNNYILNCTKSGVGYGINILGNDKYNKQSLIHVVTAGPGPAIEAYSSKKEAIYASCPGGGYYAIHGFTGGTGGGILGESTSGSGVSGISRDGDAGYFVGHFGVSAFGHGANGIGVFGEADYGIYGTTDDNVNYYAGYFVGDVYSTTGVFTGSDRKLKQNIIDFTKAMDIINELQPKKYEFKHDGTYQQMNLPQGQHYGLIAQDVEKILPRLVKDSKFTTLTKSVFKEGETQTAETTDKIETTDFKALNYTEFIPIIIKGMQELQKVNDAQQKEIEELKETVRSLTGSNASAKTLNEAYLLQNSPNPFTLNTIIRCYIPSFVKKAQLIVYNNQGKQLKQFALNNNGLNNISINANTLSSGQYIYSLLIDGEVVDSKNMIITK